MSDDKAENHLRDFYLMLPRPIVAVRYSLAILFLITPALAGTGSQDRHSSTIATTLDLAVSEASSQIVARNEDGRTVDDSGSVDSETTNDYPDSESILPGAYPGTGAAPADINPNADIEPNDDRLRSPATPEDTPAGTTVKANDEPPSLGNQSKQLSDTKSTATIDSGHQGTAPSIDGISHEPGYVIKPYTAKYKVRVRGLRAGFITINLTKEEYGWLQQSTAIARGLARLFTDNIFEDSFFYINEDMSIVPTKYHLRNDDESQWIRAEISGAGQRAQANFHKVKNIEDGPQEHIVNRQEKLLLDEANWMIQAATDYLNDHLPRDYDVLGIGGFRSHRLVYVEETEFRIDKRAYECVLLKRIRLGKKNDRVKIWLAKSENYIPVNIERHKGDKRLFQAKLMELTIH